ncbi:MAG TPA: GGDEF domain-containing protein, partial [Lysobacter sp.]|nr:GGDEF domain-containing protein [Lysobacter sp.]
MLCLAVVGSSAATPFDNMLREADEIRSTDPERFNRLLEQLDRAAIKASPAQRQQLRLLHAYQLILTGNYQNSIDELQDLLAEAPDVDLQYRATALLANNYAATREFSEGFAAVNQMLELREKIVDPDLRQRGLLTAAVLYNQAGQYDLGRHYAELILGEQTSGRSRCFAGNLRLEALLRTGQLPAEDDDFQAIIRQCEAEHEGVATGLARGFLAQKWHTEGKTANSIALLDEHMDEVLATRYPRLIGEIHALLAQYRLAIGDIAKAEIEAKSAIEQSSSSTFPLPLVAAYKTLYEIDQHRKDPIAALQHYRSYAEADKAYLNDIKARELAYQLARHETLQKNQQIALLDRKNQVLQLQQRVDKQSTQNTQLLAALLAVLLASIGYWAYKTKRMQMSFRRLAETDTLTGISNRHHFTRQAEQALAYCARSGEDVGLIMFDLDHFKAINDRYGHVTGDFVLTRVAQECKKRCRRNDRFGRIGGEEFAILLIGCDLETTTRMAHVCCAHIAEVDTSESGHCFPVTASFGVTTASLSGYELTRMLSHADQMLYRSKHDGRNRVSVHSSGPTRE